MNASWIRPGGARKLVDLRQEGCCASSKVVIFSWLLGTSAKILSKLVSGSGESIVLLNQFKACSEPACVVLRCCLRQPSPPEFGI